MPRPMTEQERDDFLAEPHVAVLTVASDDDRPPLTTPIWYHYQPGGNLTFFTETRGQPLRKTRLIERAGVLSLCVQREELPYKYVTAEGTVTQIDHAATPEQILPVICRYLPEEMAQGFVAGQLAIPDTTFVLFTIRPDRWASSDFSEDAG